MTTNISKFWSKSFFIMGFLSLVIACNKEDGPEQVAEKFLVHISKAEFKEAKEYCDEKSGGFLDMMAGMVGENKPTEEEAGTIEIIKSEINEDKAKVTYKNSNEEGEKTLDLVKVDDKWLVTIDKESQNKEEGDLEEEDEEEGMMFDEEDSVEISE
jgi:major membrane immunogen (membrane-anchored lipoprotein)